VLRALPPTADLHPEWSSFIRRFFSGYAPCVGLVANSIGVSQLRLEWSVGVVVDPPFFDDVARLVEVGEQMFVQALVAQSALEALDEAIFASVYSARCSAIRRRVAAARQGWRLMSARCRFR